MTTDSASTRARLRARLRGMLLIEAMYPRLAPDLMSSYKERELLDRMRCAAIVCSLTLLNQPLRIPVNLDVLEAVNLAIKKGRRDVDAQEDVT